MLSPLKDFKILLLLSKNDCILMLHCCLSIASLDLFFLQAMIAWLIKSKLRLELFLGSRPTFSDSLSFTSADVLDVLDCFNELLIASKNSFFLLSSSNGSHQ